MDRFPMYGKMPKTERKIAQVIWKPSKKQDHDSRMTNEMVTNAKVLVAEMQVAMKESTEKS